jgi:Zn-dependent protease with chaperone function/uncharacterized tellurite resistance protein B-like protein
MDFFTQQEKARKKTGLLVFFFVIAVILIIVALYGVIAAILYFNKMISSPLQPELLAGIIAITLAIVLGGSLFKMKQLGKGGRAVAAMLGARPVESGTKDIKEKQLLNVVEEMAIASGTLMPSVYVIEEQGVNAFAAGWKNTDAAVCVTRGCLEYLTRDELQGVIAHEFSHIFNGDMRLNIRLMGFIFGILVIGQIGYWVLRGTGRSGGMRVRSSSKGKGGGGAAVVMLVALALLVIGYIGVFFGNMIKAAVSRAREYLADSSAVQFTRNPSGISGALKKIGGLADGSRITHPNASQASHLFFANGLSGFWSTMFATHPPLEKRIRAIEPGFDGEFPVIKNASVSQSNSTDLATSAGSKTAPTMRFDPALLLASVGSPTSEHVAFSSKLAGAVPNFLRLAMIDRIGAQAVVAALLLNADSTVHDKQIAEIGRVNPRLAPRVVEIEPLTLALDRNLYATVCSIAVNTLRSMDQAQFTHFSSLLKSLVEADQKIDLFEYMLQRMIGRYLEPHHSKTVKPGKSIQSLASVAYECGLVLSMLAWESASSTEETGLAFIAGSSLISTVSLSLVSRELCSLSGFDKSLNRLDLLIPPLKKQLLSACVAVVSTDGLITINEAEYIRTIADALECPMPPVIIE